MTTTKNNTINDSWDDWNQFTRELKSRIEQSDKKLCLVKLRDGRIMEVTYTPENKDYSEMFMCVDDKCHLCWSLSGRNYTSTDFDILEIYETEPDTAKTISRFQINFVGQNWDIWKDGDFLAGGLIQNGETIITENKGMKEDLIFFLIEDVLN